MSATRRQELILPVDWDIIDACNGFSFDMGGSVMKIVFVDKDDWIAPNQRKPGSKGNLHMVNFARSELDQAMDFLVERVCVPQTADGSTPSIYSTGFGGSQYAEDIQNKVHVKNVQLMELDCFNASFLYLVKNLPRKEVLHPVLREPFEKAIAEHKKVLEKVNEMKGMSDIMDNMLESINNMSLDSEQLKERDMDSPLVSDGDLFPCGIMMCGSAFGFSIIEADGTNRVVRASARGGKMFLALGSLMLGTKSFEELMDLCAKGNRFNVSSSNVTALEGVTSNNENDPYGMWSEMSEQGFQEELVFCYGQAHDKAVGDFKREDLASCILDTHINDLVSVAYTAAATNRLKHVFFCGGFVNHPVVRKVLTDNWLFVGGQTQMMDKNIQGEIQLHFMVHSQSLGALGALLNHKLKWSEKQKSEREKPQEENKQTESPK